MVVAEAGFFRLLAGRGGRGRPEQIFVAGVNLVQFLFYRSELRAV